MDATGAATATLTVPADAPAGREVTLTDVECGTGGSDGDTDGLEHGNPARSLRR